MGKHVSVLDKDSRGRTCFHSGGGPLFTILLFTSEIFRNCNEKTCKCWRLG